MNKKTIRTVLATAMAVSMTVTAFATSGYDLTKVDKVTGTAVTEIASNAVEEAVKENKPVAEVKVQNANEFTVEAFEKVAEKAAEKKVEAKVVADTVDEEGVVLVRIKIDPVKAVENKVNVQLKGGLDNEKTRKVFNKFFKNEMAIVSFDQAYSFGQEVEIAAKVDMKKIDTTKQLYFYSYNPATNSFIRIVAPKYRIDENGYVHFSTTRADSIIITDMPLTRK